MRTKFIGASDCFSEAWLWLEGVLSLWIGDQCLEWKYAVLGRLWCSFHCGVCKFIPYNILVAGYPYQFYFHIVLGRFSDDGCCYWVILCSNKERAYCRKRVCADDAYCTVFFHYGISYGFVDCKKFCREDTVIRWERGRTDNSWGLHNSVSYIVVVFGSICIERQDSIPVLVKRLEVLVLWSPVVKHFKMCC